VGIPGNAADPHEIAAKERRGQGGACHGSHCALKVVSKGEHAQKNWGVIAGDSVAKKSVKKLLNKKKKDEKKGGW